MLTFCNLAASPSAQIAFILALLALCLVQISVYTRQHLIYLPRLPHDGPIKVGAMSF